MSLGSRIGHGRTAQVYAWGEGQVIKLYEARFGRGEAVREARGSRSVHAAGVAAPAAGDVVELDGRFGVVLERIDGPSMMQAIAARPWRIFGLARMLAETQVAMHARTAPGLRRMKDRLAAGIERADPLPPGYRQVALRALAALPDGDAICHGDYHPDNVILTGRGPVIIDWANVALGSPWADVVRTVLLLRYGIPPDGRAAGLLLLARNLFCRAYLRRYLQLRPDMDGEMAAWWLPVAAARLSEHIGGEEAQMLAIVEKHLC